MPRRLALLLLAACTTNVKPDGPSTTPGPSNSAAPVSDTEPAPTPVGAWRAILPDDAKSRDVAKLAFVDRVPGLTDEHREHLAADGFFVTAQAIPTPGTTDAGQARDGRRAKHLFQVYERNDYIRFPSYVTVDLSIDLTHQYFDVVLRKVEEEHLVSLLGTALRGFVVQAVRLRDTAKSPAAKKAAHAAATYWGTALRLLEQPAKGDEPDVAMARAPWYDDEETRAEMGAYEGTPPKQPAAKITKLDRATQREVDNAVAAVQAAAATQEFRAWGQKLDLTLARPRSHYAGSGVLQRYFRAMSLLGLSTFAVTGDDARPEFLVALAMSTAGAPKARKAYQDVLRLTNFVAGMPSTAGLVQASDALAKIVDGSDLDRAVEAGTLGEITRAWAGFPSHPILDDGPVVQPIGQRVFVDTAAMAKLLPVIRELNADRGELVARAMGPVGSAAMLGSDRARAVVLEESGAQRSAIAAGIAAGRTVVASATKRADAYHDTLGALTALLGAEPLMFEPEAHRLRMLQTFAGGWALLRHDTLLYAYQMGAECDAEALTSPYAWVEPHPEVYGRLRDMVTTFAVRLDEAGIVTKPPGDVDEWEGGKYSIGTKTDTLVALLDDLIAWSNKELAGQPFTTDERTEIAMVGGRAEHVVLTLADAFELGEGNDDMAVVADVFTFRGRALEVAVGHPELIYAVIPTPTGWALARGAVMSYREFFVPTDKRMTDETWRARVGAAKDFEFGTRPAWLADITAPPVGVIALPADGKGQQRCEYYGGAYAL